MWGAWALAGLSFSWRHLFESANRAYLFATTFAFWLPLSIWDVLWYPRLLLIPWCLYVYISIKIMRKCAQTINEGYFTFIKLQKALMEPRMEQYEGSWWSNQNQNTNYGPYNTSAILMSPDALYLWCHIGVHGYYTAKLRGNTIFKPSCIIKALLNNIVRDHTSYYVYF